MEIYLEAVVLNLITGLVLHSIFSVLVMQLVESDSAASFLLQQSHALLQAQAGPALQNFVVKQKCNCSAGNYFTQPLLLLQLSIT